jgi:adenine-specific DNA-methyltransferase
MACHSVGQHVKRLGGGVYLHYPEKKEIETILSDSPIADFTSSVLDDQRNYLIQGDNLAVLNRLRQTHAGQIDLIYIDPPFATNSVFRQGKTRSSTISSPLSDQIAYSDRLTGSAFLEFLRERLVMMYALLSDQGSLYLHIDYKIGHYVKIILDEIFGIENFRNDIARIKCNPKNFQRRAYGNVKDLLLFYTKTRDSIWNDPRESFTEEDAKRLFRKQQQDGQRYTTIPLHAPGETLKGATAQAWRGVLPPSGRHWRTHPDILEKWDAEGLIEWSSKGVPRKKIFLNAMSGKKIQDIWEFKDPAHPVYPTEKNEKMLERIVRASSNPNSIVLDAFCGSGTSLLAAAQLGRRFIGIDQSDSAIESVQRKLERNLSEREANRTVYVKICQQTSE